jgi:hypothetical protein
MICEGFKGSSQALIEVLIGHLLGGTEKNTKNISQESQYPG